MNKLIAVVVLILSFLLGGCATGGDFSRTFERAMGDALVVGVNAGVGALGGAAAGGIICPRGDRGCRQSFTGVGTLVGGAVGASRLAQQEHDQRAAQGWSRCYERVVNGAATVVCNSDSGVQPGWRNYPTR